MARLVGWNWRMRSGSEIGVLEEEGVFVGCVLPNSCELPSRIGTIKEGTGYCWTMTMDMIIG